MEQHIEIKRSELSAYEAQGFTTEGTSYEIKGERYIRVRKNDVFDRARMLTFDPQDSAVLTVGDRERTRLMRGAGVKAFSAAKPTVLVADTGAKLRGEVLVAAPSDGIALITSKAGGERALRCPAVVQYCRAGESVRAPTSEAGGLKVTFFPFIGSAR